MTSISFSKLSRAIQKFWAAIPWTETTDVSNASLAARVVRSEILLGYLYIPAAESAYGVRDLFQANEARRQAEAAYFRASRLVTELAEGDCALIAGEMAGLRTAIDSLF